MNYRTFGRTGWPVSEIGYGMWGMGGWTGSDDDESLRSLDLAVELGCNFFDTAYGLRRRAQRAAARPAGPPPSRQAALHGHQDPAQEPPMALAARLAAGRRLPADYIREMTEKSLENLGLGLRRLAAVPRLGRLLGPRRALAAGRRRPEAQGLVRRRRHQHQPLGAVQRRWRRLRTGLIDAVQVIYNIFDQAPEDELFPLCQELKIGVIARVPFDEGTLTGTLTKDSRWPEGDWRNTYFVPENLAASVERAERLKPLVPPGMTMPELALRWILAATRWGTIIPGMRKEKPRAGEPGPQAAARRFRRRSCPGFASTAGTASRPSGRSRCPRLGCL